MKKQYFYVVALCAFVGLAITNTQASTQEMVRSGKRKRSCEELADHVRAKVLARCQRRRAAEAAGTTVIQREHKRSCEQIADNVRAQVLARCQRHRAAKAQGISSTRERGIRGYERADFPHRRPGHPLYKGGQQVQAVPVAQPYVEQQIPVAQPYVTQEALPSYEQSLDAPMSQQIPFMQAPEVMLEEQTFVEPTPPAGAAPAAPVQRQFSESEQMMLLSPE